MSECDSASTFTNEGWDKNENHFETIYKRILMNENV